MSKILQLASLSLCASALAATANASRIDFVSEQIFSIAQFDASSRTGGFPHDTLLDFGQADNRQGLIDKRDFPRSGSSCGSNRVSIAVAGDTKQVPDNTGTLALFGFSALSLVAMHRKFL
jgi:hypothetical protein